MTEGPTDREFVQSLIKKLKQERDELALKIHLGKAELKDEWEKLGDRLADLNQRFEPTKQAISETSADVWESLKLVGEEIKSGFQRIRKSL